MGSSCDQSGVVRSISLPSRLDSNSLQFELNKVKSWDSSSSSSVQTGLVRLAELYNCMAEAMQSPQTQQALRKNRHVTLIEEALDGSVLLLDTCGIARDLILGLKEHVQELQSVLRRRPGQDSSVEAKIDAYTCFRKKAKKDIAKCLRSLKKMESNVGSSILDLDQDLVMVLKWLVEVNGTAVSVFRAVMEFLSEPAAGGWLLVRKLRPKIGGSSSEKSGNEIGALDLALRGNKRNVDVGIVRGRLERVDETVKGLEDGLDCIFRCLIQNRVALLNVLTL